MSEQPNKRARIEEVGIFLLFVSIKRLGLLFYLLFWTQAPVLREDLFVSDLGEDLGERWSYHSFVHPHDESHNLLISTLASHTPSSSLTCLFPLSHEIIIIYSLRKCPKELLLLFAR